MTTPQIRIKVEEFRAIGYAEIIVDGITVVAGENGCGKSTISKLLYYLYKTASNYELLVSREIQNKLRNVEQFMNILQYETLTSPKDRQFREDFRKELNSLKTTTDIPIALQSQNWLAFISKTAEIFNPQWELFNDENREKENAKMRIRRLRFILRDILKDFAIEDNPKTDLPFDKIYEFVESIFKGALEKIDLRPTKLFKDALMNLFSSEKLPRVFDVYEFEEQVISWETEHLSIPYLIQNVIYIDTPMMIEIETSENEYWNDLNILLKKKGKASSSGITRLISKEIIHGDISNDDNPDFTNRFSYKREDGSIFNLLDCATGVKSFAILQLLIKNGSINDKSLVIIDEPESNLHPQWIIEYARLIVLLNKNIGTKFFIASHNPDMVSAIRYISDKENVADNLNFYLAKKSGTAFLYDYEPLGREIDPIFESFNIAIARINQYGS
jgi:predicted ATP-dependent endonuclease of OLD family